MACMAAALALALGGGRAWAQGEASAPAQNILLSGVPATAPGIQKIIDGEYQKAVAAAGDASALTHAQMQALADRITAVLKQAGYPDAHAYLSDQIVAFSLSGGGAKAASASAVAAASAVPAPTAQSTAQLASAPSEAGVVPPVAERDTGTATSQEIAVRGFRVNGVGDHPDTGITFDSIQGMANAAYRKLGGTADKPAMLTFAQMQGVADQITTRYRKAGFIVAAAFLPAQTIGSDQMVQIQILEGRVGRIIVKGNKRYYASVIAAPAQRLKDEPLQKSKVDSALLYVRDLPGVTVASTFQPGQQTGDTDLVMVAHEAPVPFTFTAGANNYGTDLTGRYRAQAGATWNSPLGIGDTLSANADYALDPNQNAYGSLIYTAPLVVVPGMSAVVGSTRSELQINSGDFASLKVRGPTTTYFTGGDWKFMNTDDLKMLASVHFIREQSKLSTGGTQLSDEKFDLAEMAYALNHTDRRFHGVDLLQVSVRKSINDQSQEPDLVSPNHAHDFTIEKLSYTRLQFLTQAQRLYFKFNGQYTSNALAPLEQFVIGGPDSVRAYPIADGLTDRGYYTSVEYHVDAPGFGNVISPFYGRPWRELLELETFLDYARGFAAGADLHNNTPPVSFSGYGAGFIFRLPQFEHMEFHLDGSIPLGGEQASDRHGYHVYGRLGFTF
ncbi:MAG TPA: ShlB/FhaC/HecB family hemolysin secretion/activation protein [Dyella sp.]|uniref:ShlB/FhaC/HecB family hemolysin secretion/activation protein n=1 Tax=Dyella sp. TaxID=1869338 RepID=UPI002B9F75EA|nr:ShlB/FhaC/HecB family hemolysin secretion/activation protein [Dyella sp.]HTV85788.1 ShlB/FhaC/HecB family hemolysin secretion/activation protein [Dyella sp.]